MPGAGSEKVLQYNDVPAMFDSWSGVVCFFWQKYKPQHKSNQALEWILCFSNSFNGISENMKSILNVLTMLKSRVRDRKPINLNELN